MSQITFDPCIPLALWVPLALAAAGLLGWYAWASRARVPRPRRVAVIALMAVAAALPLVVLLNPTWLERIPPPEGKPLLTILVDRSASMATRDESGGRSRWESASAMASATAGQLSDRYEVRIRTFAADSQAVSPDELGRLQPDGPATDVASAIESALDAEQPQGQAILLLTDGIHNVGLQERVRRAEAKAKALAAPIYTRAFGGPAEVDDLEVSLAMPQELAFVGQRVPVSVSVRQRGSLARQTKLSLWLDGKQVEQRDAKLVPNAAREEVFQISQKSPGLYRYEIRAEVLPGEVTPLNNTAPLVLRVVDQPIRVLLLEGKPYWDTKFLVRMLSMDQSIELTSVVRMAEGRLLQRRISRPAAPAAGGAAEAGGKEEEPAGKEAAKADAAETIASRSDQWTIEKDAGKILSDPQSLAGYQIVVLGRDAEVFLTDEALQRLGKWLKQEDGSLVCFRGPPAAQINQRLGELMPVRWTPSTERRFRVRLTDEGQGMRWLPRSSDEEDVLSGMPSLSVGSLPEPRKAAERVVAAGIVGAAGENTPLITYRPVGMGRVVVVEGAGMWRWAFLPPQHQERDEVYGMLWRSLVRWLVSKVELLPSQRFALRPDRAVFAPNENAVASLLMRASEVGEKLPEIELAGGALAEPRCVAPVPRGGSPGEFYAAFGPLPEGRYRLRVVGAGEEDISAVAAFDVRGSLKERLDVRALPEEVQRIAQRSGGEVLDDDDPDALAEQFDEHLDRSRPARTAQTTAWDRWWVLAGAFALWATAWGLRRRSGLV